MAKAKKKCRTCNLGSIISGGNKNMKKLKFGKLNTRPLKQGLYGGVLCKALDEGANFIEGQLKLSKPLPAEVMLAAPVVLAIGGSMLLKPKAGSAMDDAITGAIIVGTGRIADFAWDLVKGAVGGSVSGYPYNAGFPSRGVAGYPDRGVAGAGIGDYPYSENQRATA